MSERATYVVTFDCKHVAYFSKPTPRVGDELTCMRCRALRTVKTAPPEFHLRCMACSFRSRHGAAKISAEIGAGKHRTKKPGHKVQMWNGADLVRTFGDRDIVEVPRLF